MTTPTSILVVADEWLPRLGGLSALNRYLTVALARSPSVQVHCLVPSSSVDEVSDAASSGVNLIDHTDQVAAVRPDAVVGHGRVTGDYARSLATDMFPDAALLHVVHTAPDEVGWHKSDRHEDVAEHIERSTHAEVLRCLSANRTLAVGPRLHDWLDRDLTNLGARGPIRLDPGFDIHQALGLRRPLPGTPQVLLFGRMDDQLVKGLDIAATAVDHALGLRGPGGELELVIRGVPTGQGADLRDAVTRWIRDPSVRVIPRAYSVDLDRVRSDITRASLVLMPSRAEGFGLAGLEAIALGTPTLVSGRSGLGSLLRDVLPGELADRVVVPVADDAARDTPIWGHAVAAVLRDRDGAFATAEAIRRTMAQARTWSMAADSVLAGVREACHAGSRHRIQ